MNPRALIKAQKIVNNATVAFRNALEDLKEANRTLEDYSSKEIDRIHESEANVRIARLNITQNDKLINKLQEFVPQE